MATAAATTSVGVWYWQSNADPFSGTQEHEWTMYSADNSEVIEQAYKSHQKTVKLGSTHIIDLEDYLQINVNDRIGIKFPRPHPQDSFVI
jgi:nicotinic acid phosphoribosyltransferase